MEECILELPTNEVKIISNDILQRVLVELANCKGNKKVVELTEIGDYRYWVYILRTFSSNFQIFNNSSSSLFYAFKVFGKQLGMLKFNQEKCFEGVKLLNGNSLEAKLEIICVKKFKKILNDKNIKLKIFDEVRSRYITLSIYKE